MKKILLKKAMHQEDKKDFAGVSPENCKSKLDHGPKFQYHCSSESSIKERIVNTLISLRRRGTC